MVVGNSHSSQPGDKAAEGHDKEAAPGPVPGSTADKREGNSDLITLDASLLLALQLPKDRVFILETERMVAMFIQNPMLAKTEIEPINSYYRLLVHRVARFYGLDHTIDPLRSTVIVLSRTPETHLPIVRLFELLEREAPAGPPPTKGPLRILKRSSHSSAPSSAASAAAGDSATPVPTVEQREEEYSRARARIFEDFTPEPERAEPQDGPAVVAPAYQPAGREPAAERVLFKGWNVAAPEFEPAFMLPSAGPVDPGLPPAPRIIYTKPVINFEAVPVPGHIVIVRAGAPDSGLPAFFERCGEALGSAGWEIRTRTGHQDALMLCESAVQADSLVDGACGALPGIQILRWQPRYFPEP